MILKILFITNNYPSKNHPYFGIFVWEQRQSLIDRGHIVDVYFMNSRDDGYRAYFKGLYDLSTKDLSSYDLIHTHHTISAMILICARPFIKIRKLHSYQNDPKNELGKIPLIHSIIYRYFDKIINKAITQYNSLSKVLYLPNGVNTSVFYPRNKNQCREELGLEKDTVYLLFVDSYKRRTQKRYDKFKKIITLVQRDIPNVKPLLAIGIDRSKMPIYMASSDLHLITSDFEGSPNSVKEAISCGVKVVSTPVGDLPYAYKSVAGVKVAKSFKTKELADLVLQSLTTDIPETKHIIEELGLSREQIAKKLENVYKNTISLE